mgnify:FL=1
MANKKFSEFELKTSTSDVSHVVGYNGAENVQITPANFVTTGGTGVFLPLAGGTMTGTNGVVFPDNFYLNLGTSSDFEIYHDGNNSYLKDQGTGELILASNGTGIKLEKTSGEKMIHALTDGAVELYYDSVKKFETTLLGATVTGDLLVTGTITGVGGSYLPLAGGTLTGALTGTSATFSGHLQAENRLTLTDAVAGATRYVITDETNTGTGSLVLQAGGGSAAYGGALGMYAHSHASKPGDVFAGISSASGGSFRVNTTGIDSGLDLLTINNTVAIFSPGSSEKMRLDASGNLGLGTSTPQAKMEIRSDGWGALAEMIRFSTGPGADAYVNSIVSKQSTGASSSTELGFDLNTGVSGVQSRVLTLLGSGNVGMGTSTPTTLLSLVGDESTASPQRLIKLGSNPADGNGQSIQFASSSNDGLGSEIQGTREGAGGSSDLRFLTTSTGSVVSERMRLNSAGNLGLGTSIPSNTLTLGGNDSVHNDIEVRYSTVPIYLSGGYNGTQVTNQLSTNFKDTSSGAESFTDLSNESFGGLSYRQASTVGNNSFHNWSYAAPTSGTPVIQELMRLDASGNLLIGATSTSSATGSWFEVAGAGRRILNLANDSTGGATVQRFINGNGTVGSIVTNASATAFNTSSDYRLKEDLQDFEGLDLVSKIPVYDYKWKADESRSYGVMAHELAEVLPQAVSGDKDAEEMQSVDYSKIVPLLVKSIQELKAEIELLKNK